MKKRTLIKTIQLAIGLTAVAAFLVGCGEGGGKSSSKKNNNNYNNYCGYGAYNGSNPGLNNGYNNGFNNGYGNNGYGYNNGFNNGYNQNCVQGGNNQCRWNGSYYEDMSGRPVDPFRAGCNMQGNQNQGYNQYFQAFNGDSCRLYGPQWALMNINGAWVCSIPSMWYGQAHGNMARYSQVYGMHYYPLYSFNSLATRCEYRSRRVLHIFNVQYGYCI
jgi:hypothetical protein